MCNVPNAMVSSHSLAMLKQLHELRPAAVLSCPLLARILSACSSLHARMAHGSGFLVEAGERAADRQAGDT